MFIQRNTNGFMKRPVHSWCTSVYWAGQTKTLPSDKMAEMVLDSGSMCDKHPGLTPAHVVDAF